jgi:hypothetical protein
MSTKGWLNLGSTQPSVMNVGAPAVGGAQVGAAAAAAGVDVVDVIDVTLAASTTETPTARTRTARPVVREILEPVTATPSVSQVLDIRH